jgi:hypothetical protein
MAHCHAVAPKHRSQVCWGRRRRRICVRKKPCWAEFFPTCKEEIGIEAVVDSDLNTLRTAFRGHLRRVREARGAVMVKPTAAQPRVEKLFPAVAQ